MIALLKNKSFWMAVLAVVQTLVLHYLNIDPEIWASIDALLIVVIGIFATEDIANKVVAGIRELRKEEKK